VWDQVGLSHCRHDGLVTVRDKVRLRRGHNDQSCRGHQCSETTLTGESRFHLSTPLGIEPRSLMTGSKRVDYWTSGTVYECSEIAGYPHILIIERAIYCRTVWRLLEILILILHCGFTQRKKNKFLKGIWLTICLV
jgi:hypothetical protein